MTDFTLSNVISLVYKPADPTQQPTVYFDFPDTYSGTQSDAQAYAQGLLSGAGAQSQIDALNTQIANLQSQVTDLMAQRDAANAKVAAHQAAEDKAAADLAAVKD